MESCKGEKLPVYQQSFMIDDLLTRKAIEQNGEFSEFPTPAKRKESNGERRHDSESSSQETSKRESTSTSGNEEDDDGFRKRKKPRTAFSREQVNDLEKKFQEKKYLSSAERGELAEKLKLSDMQVKTWFQNRRMKYKRQTEEAEMEMKSPKYTAYPSFVPYGSFYSGYMPMAYKSENMMHYHYQTLRSPPTPSASADSSFSPMSLASPSPFSPLHSPLSRPSPNPLVRPSANPTTSYFSNITPITPPSSTYPHHPHQSYFSTEAHTHGQAAMPTNVPTQLQFTEWPRPLPAPQVP